MNRPINPLLMKSLSGYRRQNITEKEEEKKNPIKQKLDVYKKEKEQEEDEKINKGKVKKSDLTRKELFETIVSLKPNKKKVIEYLKIFT